MARMDNGAEKERRDMDINQKAAAKGEELRSSGWAIKGIWVSKETEAPLPGGQYIFLLKMDKITEEQVGKLYTQVRKDDPWIVLFDFGEGYTGLYRPETTKLLTEFLRRRRPIFVWEAGSERKARKVQKAKATALSRRSGT
jgi:hypothetical protein